MMQEPLHLAARTAASRIRNEQYVGALGTYGGGNLGDEAVFASFLEWARRHTPPVRPVALCANPQHVRQTYGVEAFALARVHVQPPKALPSSPPLQTPASRSALDGTQNPAASGPRAVSSGAGRILAQWLHHNLHGAARPVRSALRHLGDAADLVAYFPTQLRVVRSLDAVVLLGGGQIHDFWDGPLGHPGTLFLWALACKLRRKPFIVMSVGGVNLRSRLSRWLIRRVLEWSRYVSFRDEDTAAVAQSLGFRRTCPLAPDLAWGLLTDDLIDAANTRHLTEFLGSHHHPTVIGVSPMVYQHPTMWPRGDAAAYADYLDKLAAFCTRLASQGCDVVLFATQIRSDRRAIEDLLARVNGPPRDRVRVHPVNGIAELLRCLAKLDVVVATRFHGVVLSLLVGRPALSLSYQKKNDRVLAEVGEQHFALDVHRFSLADLNQRFDELCAKHEDYAGRLRAHAHRQRERLDAQYDEVFSHGDWCAPQEPSAHRAALHQ